ncbi:hypothetical protein TEA_006052 [Camellia sinensis var. sinensis]|uniref:Uncharacterized protein n=1 Tax=Camellia sinensis var. sinensis TaxID=542762 RepID=A0A4V3WLW2_CAMSN|nr:hypothetical protein TEA_006052 [Camellia sinensis var. sinensis]
MGNISLNPTQLPKGYKVKYLWLLFDLAAGSDNLLENGPYKYIFSTEGHLLPATPQISLVREHCTYFGAYCRGSHLRQESYASDISMNSQENNGSRLCSSVFTSFASDSTSQKSTFASGLIKGVCPGLSHGQKFGISYVASPTFKDESSNEREISVQNHPVVAVASPPPEYSPADVQNDHDNAEESSKEGSVVLRRFWALTISPEPIRFSSSSHLGFVIRGSSNPSPLSTELHDR